MSENKGHGNKSPNYPELDQQGSAANRAGNQQSQKDSGNQQNLGSQQQPGRQQDAGNQQSGQRQNQQKGGQHASGGTPALDDLDADPTSRNTGSIGQALQDKGDGNSRQDKQR